MISLFTKHTRSASIFAGCLLSALLHCSPGESNGSGVGNGMIAGKLFAPDGRTPASGATVNVWKKNTLAPIASDGSETAATALYTTKTNTDGTFIIDTIDTGSYVVEGFDAEENMARIDSVHILYSDSSLDLHPDTLKAPGAIGGSIVLEKGGNPKQVFILCFGNDRYTQVGTNGTFLLGPLAEGSYRLKVLSMLEQYGSLDTQAINVTSGDTVNLGTIVMPMLEIPAIEGLHVAAYDSVMQTVKLSWNPTPASLTKGYNVFRQSSIDNFYGQPLNGSYLVHDTVFIDSSVYQDFSYEYRVAAIDLNDNQGPESDAITVTIAPVRLNIDSAQFKQFTDGSLAILTQSKSPGCLCFLRAGPDTLLPTHIEKYSLSGQLMKTWNLPDSFWNYSAGRTTIIDSADNLYVSNGNTIFRIDTSGTAYALLTTNGYGVVAFDIHGSSIAYVYVDSVAEKIGLKTGDTCRDIHEWLQPPSPNLTMVSFDSRGNIRLVFVNKEKFVSTVVTLDRSGMETGSIDLHGFLTGFSDSTFVSETWMSFQDSLTTYPFGTILSFSDLQGRSLQRWSYRWSEPDCNPMIRVVSNSIFVYDRCSGDFRRIRF